MILKARGLGVTEFFLRYLAWKCVHDRRWARRMIAYIAGTNLDLAIDFIRRFKGLFADKYPGVYFGTGQLETNLCGVNLKAFPSWNILSLRGFTKIPFVYIDEGDMVPNWQQIEFRDIVEGYRLKERPKIVWVSTPNRPDGVFNRMKKEGKSVHGYEWLDMDYKYGLPPWGRIYDPVQLEIEKLKPYFRREYMLQFLGVEGNVFSEIDIQAAEFNGYDPNDADYGARRAMGIDPGFGSSAFGICVMELSNGRIRVLYADDVEKPRYEDMVPMIMDISAKFGTIHKYYVDANNSEFVRSMKGPRGVNEDDNDANIKKVLTECRKFGWEPEDYMDVVPMNFETHGPAMLFKCKEVLENKRRYLQIHPQFDKLFTAFRTATANDRGKLDKEVTSYNDVFDAFRMCLWYFNLPV